VVASYSRINNDAWLEFEKGLITLDQLKVKRFERFNRLLEIDENPEESAHTYENLLSQRGAIYDDVIETLTLLQAQGYKMSIITNGITHVQKGRLADSGIEHYFATVIISEDIGVNKPDKEYFTIAQRIITSHGYRCERPLIIGDSPTSDLLGGYNSGIDTCYLNRFNKKVDSSIPYTYEINSLYELAPLLENID